MYDHFIRKVETDDGEKIIAFSYQYSGDDIIYHLKAQGTDKFRMNKVKNGMWKIAAQQLPEWVHKLELKFHDLIEDQTESEITNEKLIEKGFILNQEPKVHYRLDTPTYPIIITYSDAEWIHLIKPFEITPITVLYTMEDVEKVISNVPLSR